MLIVTLLLAAIVIVLYQYRHIFSLIRYRLALQSLETKEKKPSKPIVEKICPQCGEAMEEGYLVGPEGIYWNKTGSFYGLDYQFRGARLMNEPFAPYNLSISGRASVLSSSRCKRCKIIQVDMRLQDFRML
jgi:hypothetical protein